MNTPNKPAADLDLSGCVDFHVNAPFYLSAAYGHDKYTFGRLLCPVCGSRSVRFDPTSTTSVFLQRDQHYAVHFGDGTIQPEIDNGRTGAECLSLMIDFVCDAGHRFELDLHQEQARPEDGVRVSVLLSEDDYRAAFPEAAEKWEGR